MGPEGVDVGPVLEEDEPEGIFRVVMDRVEQASRLSTGAMHVLETHCEDAFDVLGSGADATRDDHQRPRLRRRLGVAADSGVGQRRYTASSSSPRTSSSSYVAATSSPKLMAGS